MKKNRTAAKGGSELPRFDGPRATLTPKETLRAALHPAYGRLGHVLDAPRLNGEVIGREVPSEFDLEIVAGSGEIMTRVLARLCGTHAAYGTAFVFALGGAEHESKSSGGKRRKTLRLRHIIAALEEHAQAARRVPYLGVVTAAFGTGKDRDSLESVGVWVWIVIADAVIGDESVPGRRGITHREAWLEDAED